MFCVSVELTLASPCGGESESSNDGKTVHNSVASRAGTLRFDYHIDIVIPLSILEQLQKQLQLQHAPSLQLVNENEPNRVIAPEVSQHLAHDVESEFVKLIRQKIHSSQDPFELCQEGVGGTYFVFDNASRKRIGVFKPTDEEPGALNNPKNKLMDQPLLPPGGGAAREVAAYLLDHKGFARVPETSFLNDVQHSKWKNSNGSLVSKSGSIQSFVENAVDTSSLGASLFLVDDVHSIGILDVRLFNMDRNSENMLAVPCGNGNKQYRLVPIDHSYVLPNKLDNAYFEWFSWKQAKVPFSAETLKYIADIDIDQDAKLLASIGIAEDCIRTMKLSTTVLKKGAAAGLTLFNIAALVSRKNFSQESELEKTVARAEKEEDFFASFERLVDEMVSAAKATA